MILVILLMAFVAFMFIEDNSSESVIRNQDSTFVTSEQYASKDKRNDSYTYYNEEKKKAELFPFDPNTADSTELLRLGLSPRLVLNIYKYRHNGGIFRQPSDFARIYGLTAGQYKTLKPYIRISDDYRPASEIYANEIDKDIVVRDTTRYPLKLKQGEKIDLNTADTTLLKRVPGIGSAFARQIEYRRKKLGGFYSTSQLMEITGFPEESLSYFTISSPVKQKLKINKATLSELTRHPYIGFYQAKTIIDHRRLHGPIKSLDDLKLYKDFPPEVIERLKHYVDY
ncbi:MAG: helix-hairpin-helix domain-containing protein [Prevotellaceae bacterium]|nr:helix-hairpin-helix domain-containing protein [Prevotellaceae bacterium]